MRWDELVDRLEIEFGSPIPPATPVMLSDDENAETYDVEGAEVTANCEFGHSVIYLHFGIEG